MERTVRKDNEAIGLKLVQLLPKIMLMYVTTELRWYFKEDVLFIRKWFENNHNLYFSKTAARDDYYLPQPGKNDSGIKLREGNIEVKTRQGKGQKIKFGKTQGGYLESWTKWSFGVNTSDELAKKIIEKRKFDWLKTTKTRLGFKLVETSKGIEVRNIKEDPENGCQIEYTRLKIREDVWYTFAVENFGATKTDLYQSILKEIGSGAALNPEASMGYPEFLSKNYF